MQLVEQERDERRSAIRPFPDVANAFVIDKADRVRSDPEHFGDELPWPIAGGARWLETAFAAIDDVDFPVDFDPPRIPPWRGASTA